MLKKILLSLSTLLIVILIALLVALYLAPGIALSFAANWYEEQGEGYQLEAKDWQFAPFATQLRLSGVTLVHPNVGAGKTQLETLAVDINLWALLDQKVEVRNLMLDGVDLALDVLFTDAQESINVAGLKVPLTTAPSEAQTAEAGDAAKSTNQATEQIAEDTTESTAKVAAEEGNQTAQTVDAEEQAWVVQVQNLEIKNQQYQWQVTLDDLVTEGKAHISKIQLTGLDTSINSQPKLNVELELQALSVSGAQNLKLNAPLTIKMNGHLNNIETQPQWLGEVSLNDFSLSLEEDMTVGFATLNLKNLLADAKTQSIESLLIKKISLVDNKGLKLDVDDISINEIVSADKQTFASLQINNISLHDDPMSVAVEQVRLEKFSNEDLKPQLASIQVKQVSLTGQEQELLSLQHYGLEDLVTDFSEDEFTVTLGKQNYAGLLVHIERNQQGQIVGLNAGQTMQQDGQGESQTPATTSDTPEAEAVEANSDKPLLLALVLAGLIQQAEQADSENPVMNKIHIKDYAIKPRLKTDINIQKINIGEVTSTIKQSDFALTNAVPFEINLGISRYNTSVIEGQLGLFERAGELYPQGEVKVTVRQLDLVPFNGYIIEALGYQLDRGSLDVDAHITFDKAQLGGEVKILLRNSKFTPKDEATIKRISTQISMPLDMAVGLLRDDHGNLRLNIPLSGDMSDPNFNLNDITKQLSQRALKAGTVFFLRQAMQPYGLMLSVASLAGDYLFAIRLEALNYVQGVSDLVDQQVDNLTKIGQLMLKKKDIEVKVCPFVSPEEAAELGENWAELANERGQKVKDWLVKYNANLSERISICRPQKGKKSEVIIGVN